MPLPKPPCCMPLQKAVKIIAIFLIVVVSLALLVATVSLVVVAMNYSSNVVSSHMSLPASTINIFGLKNYTTWARGSDQGIISKDNMTIEYNGQTYFSEKFVVSQSVNHAMTIIVVSVVLCSISLVVDVELLKGAIERNQWRCKFFFNAEVVYFFVSTILNFLVIFVMVPLDAHIIIPLLAAIGQIALNLYIIWVVYAFIEELEKEEEEGRKEADGREAFIPKVAAE